MDDFTWEIPLFSRKAFFEFFGPLIEKQVGLHTQRVYGMLQWSQNREAKQKRATLITVASKTPKKGFREKDQQKRKVAVYNRKSISEPP